MEVEQWMLPGSECARQLSKISSEVRGHMFMRKALCVPKVLTVAKLHKVSHSFILCTSIFCNEWKIYERTVTFNRKMHLFFPLIFVTSITYFSSYNIKQFVTIVRCETSDITNETYNIDEESISRCQRCGLQSEK